MLITQLLKPSNTYTVGLQKRKKNIVRPFKNASGKSKAGTYTPTMAAKNKRDNVRTYERNMEVRSCNYCSRKKQYD
jgi:hypothetical protein